LWMQQWVDEAFFKTEESWTAQPTTIPLRTIEDTPTLPVDPSAEMPACGGPMELLTVPRWSIRP